MAQIDQEEHRHWWRCEWLTRVQELADLDTQKRAWLNLKPRTWNPHFTYVEYATTYLNFADWADRVAEGLISVDEARVIADLDAKVRAYTPPHGDFDQDAILADAAWLEIVNAAGQAQRRLAAMISDPRELSALMQASDYAIEAMATVG